MIRDFIKECSFDVILNFANSEPEKSNALLYNPNLKSVQYPLTKNQLQNYYSTTNYSNLKKSYNDVNCAADVYSYFKMAYGKRVGTNTGTATGAGNSSGLNPFGFVNADLGFNLGSISWILYLLAGLFIYKSLK